MPYTSLVRFTNQQGEAVVRQTVAALRRDDGSVRVTKAGVLRERYWRVLKAMRPWLRRHKPEAGGRALASCARKLVEEGEPIGRAFRSVSELRRVFHESLHGWHGRDWESFWRNDAAAQRFFDVFLLAFVEAHERHGQRLVKEAERRHLAFFKDMIFPAFLADADGRFTQINSEMHRFLHLKKSCLFMRHINDLLGLAPDSEKAVEDYWQMLQKKKRVDRMALTLDIPEKGTRHIELSSTFRRDLRGRVIGLQGFIQNVTRRVLSERLVDEQRGTLQAVFDNVPVGLLFIDRDNRIGLVNRQFPLNSGLRMIERKNAVGKPCSEQLPLSAQRHEEPDRFLDFTRRFLADPEFSGMQEFRLTDGRTIILQTTPAHSSTGEYLGRVVMNHDITLERDLDQLREDLAQMIVHDLKNPLSAISMSTQALKRRLPDAQAGDVGELIGIISNSTNVMLGMVMNMLDVSRLEQNKLTLRREAISIFSLLDELRPNFKTIAQPRTFRFPRPRPLPLLHIDRNLVQRVLENIFTNAVRHTRPNGTIIIGLRRSGQRFVEISIADNGEGVSPEDQKTIFEKFGQALHRRRGRKTDTGLGLTFCKLAVEAHGGSIRLRSAPGKGSTFYVRLPAVP